MSSSERQKIIWNMRAEKDLCDHPDPFQSELEIDFMLEHIEGRVLNVGCGNGYETMKCADKTGFAIGVDFSEKMIEIAKNNVNDNISFRLCDALNLQPVIEEFGKFNSITSRRLLINLCSWEDQKKAINEMKKCLIPDGRLVLIEGTQEGYGNYNRMRKILGLTEIQIANFNLSLPRMEFLEFMKKDWILDCELQMSAYYFLTRVFYPLFGEPVYGSDFAKKSCYLQKKLGDIDILSPIIMGVFYVK